MGMASLIWIYHDGLPERGHPGAQAEVGRAVLDVCGSAIANGTDYAPVFNHANCVNRAAEVHSSTTQVMAWSGNRLARLEDLPDEEFEEIRRRVEREAADRAPARKARP